MNNRETRVEKRKINEVLNVTKCDSINKKHRHNLNKPVHPNNPNKPNNPVHPNNPNNPIFPPPDNPNNSFGNLILFMMKSHNKPEDGGGDDFLKPTETKEKDELCKDNKCKNPLCDHKTVEESDTPPNISTVTELKNIYDLIELGKTYHCKKNIEYAGMSLRVLCNLIQPLTELSNLVGMDNIKEHIIDQILFFLQGSHNKTKCNNCIECSLNLACLKSQNDMLHTVLTGPPGVGKTELGKILGKVYKEMGILSKGTFKLVTRSDLIAGYLGQTAIKTQKVIDECRGGVLFIDEAYALGHSELRDSFSKECIDTLNQNLSERRDFLCIIAGYEEDLEKCFFKYNSGLKRRFTFRYDLNLYSMKELLQIFELKVKMAEWSLCYLPDETDTEELKESKKIYKDEILKLFEEYEDCFPNYGGDIETLLLNCKISHSKRCVLKPGEKRRMLSCDDIKNGLDNFVKHRKGNSSFTLGIYE